MSSCKRVVMIAHDNRKNDLLDWAAFNAGTLSRHELSATGTTGALLHQRRTHRSHATARPLTSCCRVR